LKGVPKEEKYFSAVRFTPNAISPPGTSRPDRNAPVADHLWWLIKKGTRNAAIRNARIKNNFQLSIFNQYQIFNSLIFKLINLGGI